MLYKNALIICEYNRMFKIRELHGNNVSKKFPCAFVN